MHRQLAVARRLESAGALEQPRRPGHPELEECFRQTYKLSSEITAFVAALGFNLLTVGIYPMRLGVTIPFVPAQVRFYWPFPHSARSHT